MTTFPTLADLFAEEEAKAAATPVTEHDPTRGERERARHIELGWYNEDGTPGPNADPVEPDEPDDEGTPE